MRRTRTLIADPIQPPARGLLRRRARADVVADKATRGIHVTATCGYTHHFWFN